MSKLDFIDIGSSGKGGSMRLAMHLSGGINGYGIDIDQDKVIKAREGGHDVRYMDIFDIEDTARWVTCIHVMEHLPNREYGMRFLKKMLEIGDNVYIVFPNFNHDTMLYENYGLRFFWSWWTGHTWHITAYELYRMIKDLTDRPFTIEHYGNIATTMDSALVPVDALIDGFDYEADMGAKVDKPLEGVYREVRCHIKR